jgi:hypothetical protein
VEIYKDTFHIQMVLTVKMAMKVSLLTLTLNIQGQYRLSSDYSIFQAEILSIKSALKWVQIYEKQNEPNVNASVDCKSLSALEPLIIKRQKYIITFFKICLN